MVLQISFIDSFLNNLEFYIKIGKSSKYFMWGNCLFLAFMHQGDKTFFAYVFIDPETEISHVLSAYIGFPSLHVYSPSYL